ncbi:E3 ISG15--protein ligase HERC5 isoform X3 [Marmota marmota marmota]|uniref:E3 ISG15--protein ligase HERC5 isoform X3 n=1 Tax=Marmota marmota marmota TaxID=9994 RepID=UPI002092D42F|nr:E3 ISG15--protein ligase HERC5 isoform X3 [Marmota marmota marmota]
MERRLRRRSRGRARSNPGRAAASRSVEPHCAGLWLFPSASGLRSALLRRSETTRQICCTSRRLAVLERGGAGVEIHQLPPRSDGARKPKCIKLGKKMKIHSMDQGEEHILILSSDGKLFEYNYSIEHPKFQSILQEKYIIQITCGDYHSLALSKGGELFAWGQNLHGQLGVERIFPSTPIPQMVENLAGVPLVQISAGEAHSMALSMSGNVYSWGKNNFGQLGLGHTKNRAAPCLIETPDNKKVEFLACGGSHAALLTQDGLVFTFGAGKYGQLGHNSTQNELRPCLVTKLAGNRVTQVACGRIAAETMFIHSDLNKARNTFKELTQKDWIANTITTCLRDNLLKNLPFCFLHQEALEIFFLLPECPVMHDFNNWESLVVPFAETICKMSDQSLGILEEYWATLQESTFRNLVQMFMKAINFQLHYWTENSENNCHLKALLEILEKLHRVNQIKYQLSEDIFKLDVLSDWLNFYGEAYRRSCWKMNLDTSEDMHCVIFSHFPFVFDIRSKTKLLYADSILKMQERKIRAYVSLGGIIEQEESELASLSTFNLRVRRNHLIEDVLSQLSQFENEDLRRELRVSFIGEIGYEYDLGGVKTEFFYCLFEEMTRPEYGMFIYPEEASYMWFPDRRKFEEKRYFFFGVLCGLSLFNRSVANIPFPLALFKKLLDQVPSLEDLKELSPVLGKSLQTLLDDEGNDFGEVFYIHFNLHWDRNDVQLIPNGSCIVVDQTNKRDYVSKCVDYIFNISVKTVYKEFQRGFYKVCDKEIIEIFHPEELKDVIVGNTDYDWETFEKNASYEQGYNNSHPTIVMFWEALHKLTLEEKKKFLVFLTGTDRLQMKDLKNMKIRFCCPENLNEKDPMRAQTCFSVLYLPKYSTMERVEEALQVAINNSRGFG